MLRISIIMMVSLFCFDGQFLIFEFYRVSSSFSTSGTRRFTKYNSLLTKSLIVDRAPFFKSWSTTLYIFPLSLSFSLFIARFKQLSPSCEKYTTLYLQYIYNLLLKYQSHEILEEAATNNKVEYGYLCLKYNQYKCIIITYNTHTMFLNVSEYKKK